MQSWASFGPQAKHHSNGASLVGHWWTLIYVYWFPVSSGARSLVFGLGFFQFNNNCARGEFSYEMIKMYLLISDFVGCNVKCIKAS